MKILPQRRSVSAIGGSLSLWGLLLAERRRVEDPFLRRKSLIRRVVRLVREHVAQACRRLIHQIQRRYVQDLEDRLQQAGKTSVFVCAET